MAMQEIHFLPTLKENPYKDNLIWSFMHSQVPTPQKYGIEGGANLSGFHYPFSLGTCLDVNVVQALCTYR